MASTVPAKSQLHGFSLTQLTYKKDKHPDNHHLRRSTTAKLPSRKSHPSSVSPLRESMINSPLRDSVLVPPPPPRQSFLHGSAQTPIHVKSSMRGESSKRFGITDLAKQSPNRGDILKSPVRGDSMKQFAPRGDSVKQSPNRGDTVTQFSKHDIASESGPPMKSNGALIEYRRNDSRNLASQSTKNGIYSRNSDWVVEKSKKKLRATEADEAGNKQKRSRILIKIPYMNKPEENPQVEAHRLLNDDQDAHEDGKINNDDDDEPKTWNLRPRKLTRKSLNVNGVAGKYNGSGMYDNKAQSPSRNFNNRSRESELLGGSTAEKKEKRKMKFSIELLKEDIEEDIFVMTGSKPARRPKKRTKTIQKQLDNLFPGLWLSSITPDSYKVYENPPKV
ncbi:Hypothetical predicted protein [Olea europaea subsp. europaea]|uniref:Uncharacterized protein n=1 Tax=Olea europaea subsp. europaea TaxID=158383 RepID=A0A8S0RWN4_OLEEU|nr:Hypothetical predicted protein [Olea europaea subsp. europaea]